MKYFTKEQINRLQEASHYFYTAVYENYKRGTMSPLNNLVAEVYEEATGERLNPNWSCNSCCLNNFKTAGKLYFDSVKYWQDQEPVAKAVENETEKNLSQGAEQSENNSTLCEKAGTNAIEVNDTSGNGLVLNINELESSVANSEPNKRPLDKVPDTQETTVLDSTQEVLKDAEVDSTKSKVLAPKKGGRPKGSKNKKK